LRAGAVVSLALLLGLAAGGYWFYWAAGAKDRKIEEQQRIIAELEKKLDLAWSTEQVADVRVDDVRTASSGDPELVLTFIQYKPGTEEPTWKKSFTTTGEELYVDALVVTFERNFVEGADKLRGKSLLLFRRAFGDRQKPIDGVALFQAAEGSVIPAELQVDETPSKFEQRIWSRFWDLANDPVKARREGIRFAQGEAPHVKAVKGQVYKLSLRASGGLELTPRLPAAALPDQGQAPSPKSP
jgi:hypothetical protein